MNAIEALTNFLETFDEFTLDDLGPNLTCSEADAWIDLLNASGHEDKAKTLLNSHSHGDDEGDSHWKPGNTCECGSLFDYNEPRKVCHYYECPKRGIDQGTWDEVPA